MCILYIRRTGRLPAAPAAQHNPQQQPHTQTARMACCRAGPALSTQPQQRAHERRVSGVSIRLGMRAAPAVRQVHEQGRREAHNTFPERWSAAAGHRHNNQCWQVVTCQSIAVNPVGFLRYTQSKMESRTVRFWNIKSPHLRRVLSPDGYWPAFEPHSSPAGAVCGPAKRVSQPGEGVSSLVTRGRVAGD